MNQPNHTRISIKYNRLSKDYDYGIDNEYCGSAATYSQAEDAANAILTEHAELESRALPPAVDAFLDALDTPQSQPVMHSVTYIHPFSGEVETAIVTAFERIDNPQGAPKVPAARA